MVTSEVLFPLELAKILFIQKELFDKKAFIVLEIEALAV